MSNAVLLAFGANMAHRSGAPADTILESLTDLAALNITVQAVSRLYQTPAYPPGSGDKYVNAAARCSSDLAPAEILAAIHRIEDKFGRRRQARWGARTLDIDLLAVGATVLPDLARQTKWREIDAESQKKQVPEQLVLPHPRLQDRAFVLIPLAEVAPNWLHPVLHQSVSEMLANLPAGASLGIRAIRAPP